MVMIEVFHGLLLLAALLVEEISSDVVQVDKLYACLFYHLTIPLAVCVVATFYLTVLRGVSDTRIGVAPFSRTS